MAVPAMEYPEAALQTFEQGAPVFLSAGYLNECGTNPQLIMGIATKDGQNGATAGLKKQMVHLAHPDVLFVGNLDHTSTEGTTVGAATDLGKMYGITKISSSGYWYVDKSKGVVATSRVIIWDLWDDIVSGSTGSGQVGVWTDTIPRVVFAFSPGFFQGHRTS
jgi:hypothetical protein